MLIVLRTGLHSYKIPWSRQPHKVNGKLNVKRREFLKRACGATLGLGALGASGGTAQHERLNILFIFADQMHRYAMRCMGTEDIRTPNLDRLASEGVLFRNAYSVCPVCTPFRMSLMTGLYCSQTGAFRNSLPIPTGCRTVADELKAQGYRTGFVGKWHLGGKGNVPIPKELRGGFEDFNAFQCYNGSYEGVVFYDENDRPTEYRKHRTEVTTDLAIATLERMASAKHPFALFVGEQAPHYPVQPAPEYEAMYRGARIKRRPNRLEIDPYIETFSPPSPKPVEMDSDYRRYGDNLDEYLRLYYALVTQVDAGVGRMLDALDKLGLTDRTAVVFTSDHGDMQGSHGLKNKSVAYEESAGIPLVARVPGGARGLVTDALVSSVDYFPTCLDYAGIGARPVLPGRSFAPLTRGESQELPGPIFSEHANWTMIREGNFKLVIASDKNVPTELFDLDSDPYEMNNLVNDSGHAGTRDELRAQLIAWRKKVAVPTI